MTGRPKQNVEASNASFFLNENWSAAMDKQGKLTSYGDLDAEVGCPQR